MPLTFLVSTHRVFALKERESISVTDAFQKLVDKTSHKPNKIWIDKGTECYKRSMKSWFQDNFIKIYLTHMKENLFFLSYLLRL